MTTVFTTTDPVTKATVSVLDDGSVLTTSASEENPAPDVSPLASAAIYRELVRLKTTYEGDDLDIPVDSFTSGDGTLWEIFGNGDYRLTQFGTTGKRQSGTELTQRIAQILSVATQATLRKVAELGN